MNMRGLNLMKGYLNEPAESAMMGFNVSKDHINDMIVTGGDNAFVAKSKTLSQRRDPKTNEA
jgi:hypothetical protein